MYLSFYPYNKDNSGAVAFFDEFTLTFTSGAASEPALLNMADYYPHGSVMPGLNYNSSYKYRYGYQGQFAEMDDESNESNFELRNYDALLGRFKTIDPYGQYYSPYLAMGNSHPNSVDPTGGEGEDWFLNLASGEFKWFEEADATTKIDGYVWFSSDRQMFTQNLSEIEVTTSRINSASTPVSDGSFNLTVRPPSKPSNVSVTATFQSKTQNLIKLESTKGDLFVVSANTSLLVGKQDHINVNYTFIENKLNGPDLSINAGSLRGNVNFIKNSFSLSLAIGAWRYAIGKSGDGTFNYSQTYRNSKGIGYSINFSYRPGGMSAGGALTAATMIFFPMYAPYVGSATLGLAK